MDARVFSEVVGVSALAAIGAVVFVVEFFAGLLGGFGSVDLSSEGVGEVTAESIFTVSHVVMDARIEATIDVSFSAWGNSLLFCALFNCEILICA